MTQRNEVAERFTKVPDNYIREALKATNQTFAYYAGLSDEQKRLLDQGIHDGVYCGTDIHSDWTEWRKPLTAEASRRGLKV